MGGVFIHVVLSFSRAFILEKPVFKSELANGNSASFESGKHLTEDSFTAVEYIEIKKYGGAVKDAWRCLMPFCAMKFPMYRDMLVSF